MDDVPEVAAVREFFWGYQDDANASLDAVAARLAAAEARAEAAEQEIITREWVEPHAALIIAEARAEALREALRQIPELHANSGQWALAQLEEAKRIARAALACPPQQTG